MAYEQAGSITVVRRIDGQDETFPEVFAGSSPSLYYDHNDQAAKLWMVYADGGAINRRSSADVGGTWSVATQIVAVGTNPFHKRDQITGDWFVLYHDGTGFMLQKFHPGWTTKGAAVNVVAAAPVGTAMLDFSKDLGHTIIAVYADAGGAVQKVVSSDNGLTWA